MTNYVTTAAATANNGVPLPETIIDAYSREILFNAQPLLRFEQFAKRKTELGVSSGLTIKVLKYNDLSGGYKLAENVPMESSAISAGYIDVTVGERGKKIAVSELQLRAAYTDVLSDAATLLGFHLATNRDAEHRDALLTTLNVYRPNNRTSRASIQATDVFTVDTVRDVVEQLASKKVPMFNGDAYFCIIHPHQARWLRADPAWINLQNYSNAVAPALGEIGRIENMRFLDTTMITSVSKADGSVWANSADTGTDLTDYSLTTDVYQAIAIGDYALGFAVSLEAELRDGAVIDLGRQHEFGYYGIWGSKLMEENAAIVVETA